jgi:hypothetical protein
MADPKCDNCGREIPFPGLCAALGVYTPAKSYLLCSYDCITELGWKLREAQPKLSKSTLPQSTDANTI